MLDSPRSFILIIASVVVAITLVIFGMKAFKSDQSKSTDLNPVINKGETNTEEKKTTSTPSGSKTTTTAPKPSTATPTPNTKTNYTITYTNSGFTPNNLTVRAGQSVRFLNQAGASMYVMATPSQSNNGLSEFDQGKSVGRGGYFDFTFTRKGTFVYFNNNKKTDVASITVE